MHPLLSRQLRRHVPLGSAIPAGYEALLEAVSAAYTQADADMAMVEQSLDAVSQEMLERYVRLEAQKVHQATLEAEKARAEEVALLASVQLAAMRASTPELLLPEVLGVVAAGVGARAAVAWVRGPDGWALAHRWIGGDAPELAQHWNGVVPGPVHPGVSYEATAPTPTDGLQCRTLSVVDAPGDEARLDFLVTEAGAERLRDAFAVVLSRQLSAAMREQRAEQAMHAQAELLRAIGEGTPDGLTAKDASGRYLLCNAAGAHLFARHPDEVVGRTDDELCDAETAACVAAEDREVMSTGVPAVIERKWRLGEALRHLLVRKAPLRGRSGEIVGVMSVASDVTERVLMEQRLHGAQKMEALGLMAGGVAHDFNNLLTVISGNSALLLTASFTEDERRQAAREIGAAADRAAAVVRQLLTFARRRVVRPMVLDLHAILREREPMLQRLLGERVELVLRLHPLALHARFDPSQFDQVLLNLMLNARGALPDGGIVRLETDRVSLDDAQGAAVGTAPGAYVALHVTDNGVGMDEATRGRVFEPFFTTRPVGEGSGLGLSFVYGAVAQVGGATCVESAPGRGSTFTVLLPQLDAAPAAPSEPGRGAAETSRVGTRTILLVEDDGAVRAFARHVLRLEGYLVLEARNGEEALRRAAEVSGTPIALLLSDVMMPVMGGGALAAAMRAHDPDLPVLLMSGYSDDDVARGDLERLGYVFLAKPFSPQALVHAVREAMASRVRRVT